MSKKAFLSRLINKSGLIRLAGFPLLNGSDLIILAYHRVMDIPENYLFDRELISATNEEFHWQVNFIKEFYNPITFGQLFACLESGQRLPKRPVIITFDDGFVDNYTNAFQILKSCNVPATFFVCSGYLSKEETFWFDWVVYLINKLPSGSYLLGVDTSEFNFTLNEESDRPSVIAEFLRHLKNVADNDRRSLIADLEHVSGESIPSGGFLESRPMTWEQVIEMSENGMEICSHSKSHPILSRLNMPDLVSELTDSKAELESRLNKEVNVIAYPVGGPTAYTEAVVEVVKESGYKAACTYISGVNRIDTFNPYLLRRLHIEYYVDRDMFRSMMAFPSVFS